MNKFSYKDNTYTLKELIELRSKSPMYKSGIVLDEQTGEVTDISEIDKWRDNYLSELFTQREKEIMLNKKDKDNSLKLYEQKFLENRITKEELYDLIKMKQNSNFFEINYEDFFIINCKKEKPKNISVSDYGRFMLLLDLMSFKNIIQHKTNGRQIKELLILEKLEFKTSKTLKNFITKLSNAGMLSKSGHGNKRFIHINPVYAKRRIKIDQTIYDLFKEDLKEYLSEYEIKYFEMQEDKEVTCATFEII
jgi:hypothetical protein